MRRFAAVAALILTVSIVAAACSKPYLYETRGEHYDTVERMSFEWPIDRFEQMADCQRDWMNGVIHWFCFTPLYGDYDKMETRKYLNWSSDGCSGLGFVTLPDTTFAWDFRGACLQHDFCYRNWPEVADHGVAIDFEAMRHRCDNRFYASMNYRCQFSGIFEAYCIGTAAEVYAGVRYFGRMRSDRV